MADKKSLAEAVASIRRYKKIVKKSAAGIDRTFDVTAKPETKALVSAEGTAVMNPAPLQPLRRKLRLAKPKEEPVEEKKEEPVPVEEKKEEKSVKDPVPKIEKKPAKYRIKRNTMTMVL
jgi:hypothetical protein